MKFINIIKNPKLDYLPPFFKATNECTPNLSCCSFHSFF